MNGKIQQIKPCLDRISITITPAFIQLMWNNSFDLKQIFLALRVFIKILFSKYLKSSKYLVLPQMKAKTMGRLEVIYNIFLSFQLKKSLFHIASVLAQWHYRDRLSKIGNVLWRYWILSSYWCTTSWCYIALKIKL